MSNLISKTHHRYVGYSKFYKKAKENINFGEWNIGRKRSPESRIKQSNSLKGRIHSEETKKKIGIANSKNTGRTPWNKGVTGYKVHKEETKQRLSQERKGIPKSKKVRETMKLAQSLRSKESYSVGWKHDADALARIKEAARNRQKLICPHCGREGSAPQMKRYHFENCKSLSAFSTAS